MPQRQPVIILDESNETNNCRSEISDCPIHCIPPASGDWEINRECILNTTNGDLIIIEKGYEVKRYTGTHALTLSGNVLIKNNGILDMRGDSNISFSGSPRYIYVESGGELRQANTAGINK